MVSTSLFTGLSGLRAQQRYLDVIGNNLANVSTPGFWSSRATFGDILSFTMRSGSGPSNVFGGQNPMQVGLGTQIASIDLNTEQGTFQNTGRSLDVAIQGKGFFTLSDGLRTFYTRVGTFGVDSTRTLVDLRTGYRVVNASGGNISVPLTDTLPPKATGAITFQGNLPAQVTGPLEEIIESGTPFMEGTAATKSTVSSGTYDVSAFVGKTVLVSVDGGAQQAVTIPAAGSGIVNPAAATATEIAALFGSVNGMTATVNGSNVDFATIKLGTNAQLKFDDGPNSSGLLQQLGLDATLQNGTETAATGNTDLANLTSRITPYTAGDEIVIDGTNPDGTRVSASFVYGSNGTSLQNLVDFINQNFDANQVSATIETGGVVRLTATEKKPANLSLSISDDKIKNTGSSTFPTFATVQEGTGPDTASTSIDVVDSLGRTHSVTMMFTRTTTDPAVWDMTASMDPSEGTITKNTVSTIRFNPDGSFNVIGGGSSALTFLFNGLSAPQDVMVDLGQTGTYSGVAMVGDKTTVAATGQDGYTTGSLLNIAFDAGGQLQGFYTNGQSRTLDTLRISLFPNEAGLLRVGDTMFVESPNSDDPISSTAGGAGAGVIRPGALENSNVDIAEEFVKLITAQRGFQANSRVITMADQILAELVNIVR